ncbi:MAG: SCO family protein [Alphaproteobacteria bacterium]
MQRISIIIGLAIIIVASLWRWGNLPLPQIFGIQAGAPATEENTEATIGGAFSLTDHTGKTVTDVDLRGRFLLVFFGYTYCPDVCPTTLQTMTDAIEMLGDQAKSVQPVFISVDPQRDTPQVLHSYVQNFHPSLIGLTGTSDQIAAVARAYRIYFAKVTQGGAGKDNYLMNHSAISYLMGPDGKFITHFSHDTTPEKIASTIRKLL